MSWSLTALVRLSMKPCGSADIPHPLLIQLSVLDTVAWTEGSGPVKNSRRYDSSARKRQAEQTQHAILNAAQRQFLESGYAATTVRSIARDVGVSAETVYKAFGPKPALVRALWIRGLAGRGTVPAPDRSDAFSDSSTDAVAVVRAWAAFIKELAPEGSPIVLLIRDAAVHDPEMAALLAEVEEQRRERMRHNAARLHRRGWLRPGLDLDQTADILWTYSSPELYELLVIKSGWSVDRYADFTGDATIAALLAQD